MRHLLAITCLFAAPQQVAADSYFYWFYDCGGAIGTETCSPETAMAILDNLEPAWAFHFNGAGVDGFAVITVLATIKKGIENRIADGACIVNDETAFVADETWAMFAQPYAELSEGVAIDYSVLSDFVGKGVRYISEGAC